MTTNTNTKTVKRQTRPANAGNIFGAALKAGLGGGAGISLLLVIHQISFPLKNILIIPAIFIVWVVTGIAAALLAGDVVKTSRDGRKAGVVAGLISGVISGIAAMVIAALGNTFVSYGEGVFLQFSDTQLISLTESGFTEQLVILSGSVMTALFVCGIGSMITAALLGGLGGWLYPKFGE